jgi:hypothetical protein
MSQHDSRNNELLAARWHYAVAFITLGVGLVEFIWHYRGARQHMARYRKEQDDRHGHDIYLGV